MNIAIYQIRDNSFSNKDLFGCRVPVYAAVHDYGPLVSMPFLDLMPLIKERKTRAWKAWATEPGLIIDERGKDWPDFMMNNNPPPNLFVSDLVVDDLEAHGIAVWRKTEFPITSIKSKRLKEKPPPRYFVVEAEPGITIDYQASGIALDAAGKPAYTREQRLHRPPLQLDATSWDGSDLFTYRNWGGGSSLTLLCTEKVVELAKAQRWKNVKFERQPIVGHLKPRS